MARFRKKPVEIEAVQWLGTPENSLECADFLGDDYAGLGFWDNKRSIRIRTLEGPMHCPEGHWIIRGVKGEHYSCEPSIFALSYDAVPS